MFSTAQCCFTDECASKPFSGQELEGVAVGRSPRLDRCDRDSILFAAQVSLKSIAYEQLAMNPG
jgi:hypothetical protein